jgi:hypothetical protein
MEERDIDLSILKLGIRWRRVFNFTSQTLFISPHPMDRGLQFLSPPAHILFTKPTEYRDILCSIERL